MPREDVAYKLSNELQAKQVVLSQLADLCAGDEEFLRDSIEGETGLLELLDRVDLSIEDDTATVVGAKAVIERYQDRKKAAEKRVEAKRSLILNALQMTGLPRHRTGAGVMLSVTQKPVTAMVTEPADVPAKWWKPQSPTIDQAGLTRYVADRAKAIKEAASITDDAARAEEMKRIAAAHPDIPGVTESNGGVTLGRR